MPRDLTDRLDREAATWVPEVGAKLVGLVVEDEAESSDYGDYHRLTVEDDDGAEHAVRMFGTVLLNAYRRKAPRVGDRFGIKRLPDREGPRGPYKDFIVMVERAAAPESASDFPPDNDPPSDYEPWQ